MPPPLILSSASPRRQELLKQLGLSFETIPSEVPEKEIRGESHETFVKRLAERKALSVAGKRPESLVIGADTIVILGAVRLGKPENKASARKMLQRLSGQRHEVFTGLALIGLDLRIREMDVEKTSVWFKPLTDPQIEQYIDSPEPYDKAGGYGIQGPAASFIARVEGDLNNVIGLPLQKLVSLLEKAGLTLPGLLPDRKRMDKKA